MRRDGARAHCPISDEGRDVARVLAVFLRHEGEDDRQRCEVRAIVRRALIRSARDRVEQLRDLVAVAERLVHALNALRASGWTRVADGVCVGCGGRIRASGSLLDRVALMRQIAVACPRGHASHVVCVTDTRAAIASCPRCCASASCR